uniref:Synaptopodin 2 n=1 Tax=Neogobius melanostomus TaxID=47308 RepID=A0A8C6V789_9GOBI
MFKKHRQRAKKYTLVSYGTGEEDPEYRSDEEEDDEDTHTVELTIVPSKDIELTNANSSTGVINISFDKGLLETERNLKNKLKMECETSGKGAVMFAQRRLRMDEISAEHEELRRQGIPVDGILEVQKKKMEEQSYTQSAMEGRGYMDVNIHQQTTTAAATLSTTSLSTTTKLSTTTELPTAAVPASSLSNRVAKPFSAQEMTPAPYSNGDKQENQGEQIASRDERISTPAIKTGILLDTRRKTGGKPMFNFKDAPKVSPNPVLLNLLNRSEKKLGYESGTEEDYLSLGAEACNFLQSPRFKHKIPPPVAPKPMINPNTPPWAVQMEVANPDMPQCAENNLITPASAPPADTTPAAENTGNSSPVNPMATILTTSAGPAYEMLTVKGKGADMFAKRQSRMEKYIVDSETVEANKASRSASPATSLPTEWKYSSNVRAPPPRAYNPIQSPLYPPAASKQPPNSSSSSKSKKKDKNKPPPKPLNVIDVMKHQPYQLNSSLFIFGPAEEAKPPAPKPECPPPNPNPPVENQPQLTYEQMAMQQSSKKSYIQVIWTVMFF